MLPLSFHIKQKRRKYMYMDLVHVDYGVVKRSTMCTNLWLINVIIINLHIRRLVIDTCDGKW